MADHRFADGMALAALHRTMESVRADQFTLDYGDGPITTLDSRERP